MRWGSSVVKCSPGCCWQIARIRVRVVLMGFVCSILAYVEQFSRLRLQGRTAPFLEGCVVPRACDTVTPCKGLRVREETLPVRGRGRATAWQVGNETAQLEHVSTPGRSSSSCSLAVPPPEDLLLAFSSLRCVLSTTDTPWFCFPARTTSHLCAMGRSSAVSYRSAPREPRICFLELMIGAEDLYVPV